MEPLIKREEYLKRVNKLVHAFPIILLIGSVFIVIIYHSISLILKQDHENLFGFAMLSESFFQGTVITVVVYFFKSRIIGGVIRTKPTDFAYGKIQGYLPVVVGTNLRKQKIGYLLVENNELVLYVKKPDGYALETKWSDLSKVKFSVEHESYNVFMLLVYGFRESILVSDGKNTLKVVFPKADISVSEINESIQSYTNSNDENQNIL